MEKDEQEEIIEQLYQLEEKECSKYTQEDNLFVFRCLHSDDERIVKTAQNTVAQGMWQYINVKANTLFMEVGPIGGLTVQSIEDIMSVGLEMLSKQMMNYDPSYGTQIHSYTIYWIDRAMRMARDKAIRGTELSEAQIRALKFIGVNEPVLKERGIYKPTAQDYFQLAIEQGKDTIKYYNLTNLSKMMSFRSTYGKQSLEALEENGITINTKVSVYEEVEQKQNIEIIHDTINKLAYFERLAIESKIIAKEEVEKDRKKKNDARTIYVNAYRIFKIKSKLEKISQRDFSRLLTDATNELSERLAVKQRRMVKKHVLDNSLKLDDSFDSLFGEEMEINHNDVSNIFDKELSQKYPMKM